MVLKLYEIDSFYALGGHFRQGDAFHISTPCKDGHIRHAPTAGVSAFDLCHICVFYCVGYGFVAVYTDVRDLMYKTPQKL